MPWPPLPNSHAKPQGPVCSHGREEVVKVGCSQESEPDPWATRALSLPPLTEDQRDVGAHSQQAGPPLKPNLQHPDLSLPGSRAVGLNFGYLSLLVYAVLLWCPSQPARHREAGCRQLSGSEKRIRGYIKKDGVRKQTGKTNVDIW